MEYEVLTHGQIEVCPACGSESQSQSLNLHAVSSETERPSQLTWAPETDLKREKALAASAPGTEYWLP
jgi:hypothetical protein